MQTQASFPGWPSGDFKPIMETTLTPQELTSRLKLQFSRDRDDLDWFQAAFLVDETLGPVVFRFYENSPNGGTDILVDTLVDTVTAKSRLKASLKLSHEVIRWERGFADDKGSDEGHKSK
jgi:hypothetical protein